MATMLFQNGHRYTFAADFPFDVAGHPMVRLRVFARDGVLHDFLMLADTGADRTLMPASDAATLGIPKIQNGCRKTETLGTAGLGSVTAFFHGFLATLPNSGVFFRLLIGFSNQVSSRLFGRPDMLKEFVVAFDRAATHFLRG